MTMTDLNERLRGIDRLSPPDLWEAAQARAEAGVQVPAVSPGRRFAIIAASLTIGLAAVAWVVVAIRPESRPPSLGTVPAGTSRIDIALAADGAVSASWTYGDAVLLGVAADVLGPGPASVDGAGDQGSPVPGTVTEFLGVEGFSIDYGALGAVEPSAMSIPSDVPITSDGETALLAFRAGEGQGAGYVEWGQMTALRTPTDLRRLESGGRYRIVVVTLGTDDALFQFAFDIDVMPQSSATAPADPAILVSSSGPSGDTALLTGTLTIENGCLAVSTGPDSSLYVVWPAGYALEEGWLLDDSGSQIARIGDEVQMGGGITNLAHAEPSVPDGIPASCEVGGPDAYWFAGTPELVGPSPVASETEAVRVPGIDAYKVCRVLSLPGDFGDAGDEVVVFEEERVPTAGCVGSEGFQHVAVLRDGRVTALSRRITDVFGDAWRVWPYATPDLNDDGIDEIAVALRFEAGNATRVWFLMLSPDGSGIEGIYESSRSQPFTHLIGTGTDPLGLLPQGGGYGVFCDFQGDAQGVVTWRAGGDDPSQVTEQRWWLYPSGVDLKSETTVGDSGTAEYPDDGSQELCGSPVSTRTTYPGQTRA
jgi:hypothetical protein